MSASRDYQARFLTASRKQTALDAGSEAGQGRAQNGTSRSRSAQKSKDSLIPSEATLYRLGAYIRLSPSDEIRGEGSLVSHPQRIKNYVDVRNAQQPGWGKIVEFYEDKDMSGKDMNRPAFKQMLRDIQLGKINAVVATELSRLSRNVKDFCEFWEFLKGHKATFFSLKENFDTSTPIGEMMVIQCISFAQFERKTIVQRIKDGSRARAERGLAHGGQRLLGLDPDPTRTCRLVVNSAEVPVVQHLFEKFIEIASVHKLMKYLHGAGIRTKTFTNKSGKQVGGNIWTESSLYNLLTNLALIGKREINKKNRHIPPDELADAERYKVVDASWPAIMSEDLFWKAQDLLFQNRVFLRRHTHVYRLTGLLECGVCGEVLSGKASTGRAGMCFITPTIVRRRRTGLTLSGVRLRGFLPCGWKRRSRAG